MLRVPSGRSAFFSSRLVNGISSVSDTSFVVSVGVGGVGVVLPKAAFARATKAL